MAGCYLSDEAFMQLFCQINGITIVYKKPTVRQRITGWLRGIAKL